MNPTGKARELFAAEKHAVLSTHSQDVPGYPFGSFVTYALDGRGRPLIHLSRLAQHTRNILKDPRVSLTVVRLPADGSLQGAARATMLGEAALCSDPEPRELYYLRFPGSKSYEGLDFDFFRIEPARVRYIGGFGEIFWVEPDQYLAPSASGC